MTIDMKPTVKECPRQHIYTQLGEVKILCNPLPIPKGNVCKTLRDHPDLFRVKSVTPQYCEVCLGRELPSLRKQLATYVKTVTKWGIKGGKERSEEEINRIWAICQQCDALKDGKCMECGCSVGLEGRPIKNKLKMDTTHCTRGLW